MKVTIGQKLGTLVLSGVLLATLTPVLAQTQPSSMTSGIEMAQTDTVSADVTATDGADT